MPAGWGAENSPFSATSRAVDVGHVQSGHVAERHPQGDLVEDPAVRGWIRKGARERVRCRERERLGRAEELAVAGGGAADRVLRRPQREAPGVVDEQRLVGRERRDDAAAEQHDPEVERRDRDRSLVVREPGEERLVDEGAVRLVLVAGGVDLLAGRDVRVLVAVEEPLDVLEEDRVAVEVERLMRAGRGELAEVQEAVQQRVARQRRPAGGAQLGEPLLVRALLVEHQPVGAADGGEPGGRAAVEEHDRGDARVVLAQRGGARVQLADQLGPVLPVREGDRVVDQPASVHVADPLAGRAGGWADGRQRAASGRRSCEKARAAYQATVAAASSARASVGERESSVHARIAGRAAVGVERDPGRRLLPAQLVLGRRPAAGEDDRVRLGRAHELGHALVGPHRDAHRVQAGALAEQLEHALVDGVGVERVARAAGDHDRAGDPLVRRQAPDAAEPVLRPARGERPRRARGAVAAHDVAERRQQQPGDRLLDGA